MANYGNFEQAKANDPEAGTQFGFNNPIQGPGQQFQAYDPTPGAAQQN